MSSFAFMSWWLKGQPLSNKNTSFPIKFELIVLFISPPSPDVMSKVWHLMAVTIALLCSGVKYVSLGIISRGSWRYRTRPGMLAASGSSVSSGKSADTTDLGTESKSSSS
jgi:hypothetical protein